MHVAVVIIINQIFSQNVKQCSNYNYRICENVSGILFILTSSHVSHFVVEKVFVYYL